MNTQISRRWDHDPAHFQTPRTIPTDWSIETDDEGMTDFEHYATWGVFAFCCVVFVLALLRWWFE